MKRIFLLLTLIILGTFLLTGCGSSDEDKEKKTYSIETSLSNNTFIFETDEVNEYFSFLENFDHESYEIVNIDTFIRETLTSYSDDYYMITYKKIN